MGAGGGGGGGGWRFCVGNKDKQNVRQVSIAALPEAGACLYRHRETSVAQRRPLYVILATNQTSNKDGQRVISFRSPCP